MKIGDTVLIVGGGYSETLHRGEIIGETKTSWRVEYVIGKEDHSSLYNKDNYHLRGGVVWSSARIREFNEKEWSAYCKKCKRANNIRRLQKFDWTKLKDDDIQNIINKAYDLANRS